MGSNMYTYEEAEKKYGKDALITLIEATTLLGIKSASIKSIINRIGNEDIVRSMIVVVYINKRRRDFFIKSKIEKFVGCRKLGEIYFDNSTVYKWLNKGLIVQPPYLQGTTLWDVKDLHRQRSIYEESKNSWYDLLHENIKSLIEEYLEYRSKRLTDSQSLVSSLCGRKFPKITDIKTHKASLVLALIRIALNRCNVDLPIQEKVTKEGEIVERIHLNTPYMMRDYLTEYNKDVFDNLEDLNVDNDILPLFRHISQDTAAGYSTNFRAFLGWYYDKRESEVYTNLDVEGHEQRERKLTSLRYHLKQVVKPLLINRTDKLYEELFLQRAEILQVFFAIKGIKNISDFTRLRDSVIWMIGAFAHIRPCEIIKLKINDFVLDEKGFIKKDKIGFGTLVVRKLISKQQNSASDPSRGHINIVPRLVNLVNDYLENLYSHGKTKTDWLLTTEFGEQYKHFLSQHFRDIIRPQLIFLNEEERKKFEMKTGRRSGNNTIVKFTWLKDETLLNNVRRGAAIVHSRHSLKGVQRSMGNANETYVQKPTKEEYRKIIDEALNYPWDLDMLKTWEKDKGYVKDESIAITPVVNEITLPTNVESLVNETSEKEATPSIEIQQQLLDIESKLAQNEKQKKNMKGTEFRKIRYELKEQKERLEGMINGA